MEISTKNFEKLLLNRNVKTTHTHTDICDKRKRQYTFAHTIFSNGVIHMTRCASTIENVFSTQILRIDEKKNKTKEKKKKH